MRAVASFGDDPEKIVVVLPPGDPQVMLADVATKFRLRPRRAFFVARVAERTV